MGIEELMIVGWRDHGDDPQAVADQLPVACQQVETPEQAIAFARLLVHVYGEHLDQWQHGVDLLTHLGRQLPEGDPSEAARISIQQCIASLRYASGTDDEAETLQGLAPTQRVSALAIAATALAARDEIPHAIAAFDNALQTASAGLPEDSPANRGLAIAGNNLATILEDKPDRLPSETEVMVVCAQAALTYWKLAGTWLEVERAEFRLARSLLHAGQASAAVDAAKRCADVCAANSAPAFELSFGYAVLGIAQRSAGQTDAYLLSQASARAQWQAVPEADRSWCQSDLHELNSLTGA